MCIIGKEEEEEEEGRDVARAGTKTVISLKRDKIGLKLLLKTNNSTLMSGITV